MPYTVEVTILYLTTLLSNFRRGFLAIPAFARPMEWKGARQVGLVQDVLREVPIGGFMQWECLSGVVVPYKGQHPWGVDLSTHFVDLPEALESLYVVDGVSRLLTLYLALYDHGNDKWRMFVDLGKSELPVFQIDGFSGSKCAMPLSLALDNEKYSAYRRTLRSRPDTEVLLHRADTVAELIRHYKVPVTTLRTKDTQRVGHAILRANYGSMNAGVMEQLAQLRRF